MVVEVVQCICGVSSLPMGIGRVDKHEGLVCVEARVVSRCNVETGMTKGTLRTRRLRQSTTRLERKSDI